MEGLIGAEVECDQKNNLLEFQKILCKKLTVNKRQLINIEIKHNVFSQRKIK